jgi:NADH dehydrogenase FAD-containing subunit
METSKSFQSADKSKQTIGRVSAMLSCHSNNNAENVLSRRLLSTPYCLPIAGLISVDRTYQVIGAPHVFAIGDAADTPEHKTAIAAGDQVLLWAQRG